MTTPANPTQPQSPYAGLPTYPQQYPQQYAPWGYTPPWGYLPVAYAPIPRRSEHGAAALVLGILSLFIPLLCIPGLVCSIAGLKEGKQDPAVPTGMATAGLITSIIGLVWTLWLVTFLFVFLASMV